MSIDMDTPLGQALAEMNMAQKGNPDTPAGQDGLERLGTLEDWLRIGGAMTETPDERDSFIRGAAVAARAAEVLSRTTVPFYPPPPES